MKSYDKKVIQSIVVNAIKDLEEYGKDKRVALVTFNSNVYLIGDGKIDKTTLKKIKIDNNLPKERKREIEMTEIEMFANQVLTIDHVGRNKGLLREKVLEYVSLSSSFKKFAFNLNYWYLNYRLDIENDGGTALGPALYTSVKIAARMRASRVFLFTNGIPSHGIGALDDPDKIDESRKFYEDVNLYAQKRGYI